jgi:hypothetical protein
MRNPMMLKVPAGLIAAVLAVASLAPAAQAQDAGFVAKMNVPFAFQTASGQHFAPGVYTIRMNGENSMLIRSNTSSGLALTQLANDGLPATDGKAVFTHYGDRYFLRAVWVTGDASHLLFKQSKAERETQIVASQASPAAEVALVQAGR